MTDASRQPKDKNYNLISVLYQSSDNVESLKTFVEDAESEGDQELVDFFRRTVILRGCGPSLCPLRCPKPHSASVRVAGTEYPAVWASPRRWSWPYRTGRKPCSRDVAAIEFSEVVG